MAAAGVPLQKLRQSLRPADDGFGQGCRPEIGDDRKPVGRADGDGQAAASALRGHDGAGGAAGGGCCRRPVLRPRPVKRLPAWTSAICRTAAPRWPSESSRSRSSRFAPSGSLPHRGSRELTSARTAPPRQAPPPATGVAMLAGPASEPLRVAAETPGKGGPAGLALDNFAPLAVTEVPRLNRAVRPVAPLLPGTCAEMEALSAPANGSGSEAGNGSGSAPGQGAGASLGSVDVSRPICPPRRPPAPCPAD